MKISWQKTKEEKGILVAFDIDLLPFALWWYQSLRKHSSLPIAFVDLGGFSDKTKEWCKKNGYYINCEKYVSYFKGIKIPEENIKKWSEITIDLSLLHSFWFTKPIAMMHTPFKETLYLDIDCEVRGSVDEIFSCLEKNEISLCKDAMEFGDYKKNLNLKMTMFNSGVIAYKHRSEIIEKWAQQSIKQSCNFITDQDLLSHIIDKFKYKPNILPIFWNWHRAFEANNLVVIYHWCGQLGKKKLFEKLSKDIQLINEIKELLN